MADINISVNNGLFSITLDKWEWTGLAVNGQSISPINQGNIQFQYNQNQNHLGAPVHFIATSDHNIKIVNPPKVMYLKGSDDNKTYLCAIHYHTTTSNVTLYGFLHTLNYKSPYAQAGPILFSQGRMTGTFQDVSLQKPFTIEIDPLKDVVDIEQGRIMGELKGYEVNPGGVYELSYVSDVHYHGSALLVNKVVVYNTTDNNPDGWFYLLESGGTPQIIKIGERGTKHNMLYAFLVDITSRDNTGTGTLTVTQIA